MPQYTPEWNDNFDQNMKIFYFTGARHSPSVTRRPDLSAAATASLIEITVILQN